MAKMNSQKMRKLLEERLTGADWSFYLIVKRYAAR